MNKKTVKVKRCHSYVEIPKEKYDPNRHELYEEPLEPVKEKEKKVIVPEPEEKGHTKPKKKFNWE